MVVTKKNLLMASVGVAMAFNFSACKKDKASQTDKLVGDWKLISYENDPVDEDYLTIFEFDENQDFRYCVEEVGEDDKYCYSGNWEWSNEDETKIDISIMSLAGYSESFIFEIDKLSDDELEGDFDLVGYNGNSTYKFEKID